MSSEHTCYEADRGGDAVFSFQSPTVPYQSCLVKPKAPFMTPTMANRVPKQHLASTPMVRLRSSPAVMFPNKSQMNPFTDVQAAELYAMMSPTPELVLPYDVSGSITPAEFSFSCSPTTPVFNASCSAPLMWSNTVTCQPDYDQRASMAFPAGTPLSPTQSLLEQPGFNCSSESSYAECSAPTTPETIDPAMTIAGSPTYLTVPDSPLLPSIHLAHSNPGMLDPAFSQHSFDGSDYMDDSSYACTPMTWESIEEVRSPPRPLFDPIREERFPQPPQTNRPRRRSGGATTGMPVRRSGRKRTERKASPRNGVTSARTGSSYRPLPFPGQPLSPNGSDDEGCDDSWASGRHFFSALAMKDLDRLGVNVMVAESTAKGCVCPGCGAKFRRPEHLTRHKKSAKHNTAKLYACDLQRCVEKDGSRKAFNRQDNKTAHIVKTHLTPAFAEKGRRDRVTYNEAVSLGWEVHFPAARKEYEKLLAANGGKGPTSEFY